MKVLGLLHVDPASIYGDNFYLVGGFQGVYKIVGENVQIEAAADTRRGKIVPLNEIVTEMLAEASSP